MADAGGNWLVTFPTVAIENEPAYVLVDQTWPASDPESEHGYKPAGLLRPCLLRSRHLLHLPPEFAAQGALQSGVSR